MTPSPVIGWSSVMLFPRALRMPIFQPSIVIGCEKVPAVGVTWSPISNHRPPA
jgi:hypothetical protein